MCTRVLASFCLKGTQRCSAGAMKRNWDVQVQSLFQNFYLSFSIDSLKQFGKDSGLVMRQKTVQFITINAMRSHNI